MDVVSLNKLTVPQLKKELKERGLPLGGVKADLVARLHAAYMPQATGLLHQPLQPPLSPTQSLSQSPLMHLQPYQLEELQQLQSLPPQTHTTQQLYTPQSNQFYQLPLLTTNLSPLLPRTTTKTMVLSLGLVDARDKFGSVVSAGGMGEEDMLVHEGFQWCFYCTKSMDYQIWSTVYLKCMKKQLRKHGLPDDVPSIEATVEFPTGKKVKGVLNRQNEHRLVVVKEANSATLTKSFGANNKETIHNVKVTLRTLTEGEARQAEQTSSRKKPKTTQEDGKDLCADWGVYGQMDSDDENRSEYESSDYSSSSESGD